jgi:hypothetical protein
LEWLYKNNSDNSSRFALGIHAINPLVCIGINPSTATPECLDNTLRSVERISINSNFDSWIMLNIYPQRATNPNDLHHQIDDALHKSNIECIDQVLSKYRPTIWAAWGKSINRRNYLFDCLADIADIASKYNCQWISFGEKTKEGHPRHPLYLAANTQYKEFIVDEYLKEFET